MFIILRKGLVKDGNYLVFFVGYGGFNVSMIFNFSVFCFVFVCYYGVVVVVVNIWGGGEYGEEWYKDGMFFKKKNSFDDFIVCFEFLICEGYI